jgi:hypothetical protein
MINADSAIGSRKSAADTGGVLSTTASSAKAKNPTARCAIGEIRMTTGAGGVDADGVVTPPFWHCAGRVTAGRTGGSRNLTCDQCGGYRHVLCERACS